MGVALLLSPGLLCAQDTQLELPGLSAPFVFEAAPMFDPSLGWIWLDMAVTDKSGTPVTGLTQQDFTIQDNGQSTEPVSFQPFDGVKAIPDAPVEVILVIDELNMNPGEDKNHVSLELEAVQKEAESFLRKGSGRLPQPVLVYRITEGGLTSSGPPSVDGDALGDEIAHRREAHPIWKTSGLGSFHPLRKAADFNLQQSLEALGSIALEERRRPGRKLMFWLGPGWRTEGFTGGGVFDRVTELSTRLREARIELWQATEGPIEDAHGNPIPVHDAVFPEYREGLKPEDHDHDVLYLALPVIATQTGGGVLKTNQGLFALIGKRVEQANQFYALTFNPPPTYQVDEYHRLQVTVSRPGLSVHTRNGYFDEPVFYDQSAKDIERVTVEQLQQAVATWRRTSDSDLARHLSRMKLTERVSSARRMMLESNVPGRRARQALIALVDASVFLDPPATDIEALAPPDAATQRKMIGQVTDYVAKTVPRLPNFFAERTTVQYQQAPPTNGQTWKTATGDPTMYAGGSSKATVRFRDGKEVVEEETVKGASQKVGMLRTVGTFGPILSAVLLGATATHGDLRWSHWEKGSSGPVAVFRYRATQERGLYHAGAVYIRRNDTAASSERNVGFHGEFAIDPATGAILRLTMQADLAPRLPVDQSSIMVEYGPVMLGGEPHICPLRSVSISRQRRITDLHAWNEAFEVYAPFETLVNDVTFGKYHLMHSSARLLPGYTPAPPG